MTAHTPSSATGKYSHTIWVLTTISHIVGGDIGPRTEKLVEYGIIPLRNRGRKAKSTGEGESAKPERSA